MDETEIRLDELSMVWSGMNSAAWKRDGISGGARNLNLDDLDYYLYLRRCELEGKEPLATFGEYIESRR
jgi:hypothetical protein